MKQRINIEQVANWLKNHYGIEGELKPLVGDVDLNFHCQSLNQRYTVKISCVESINEFEFEAALLSHIFRHTANHADNNLQLPNPINNQNDEWLTICQQSESLITVMRVLTWVHGTLWSGYLPHTDEHLKHLGQQAATLDQVLKDFRHPTVSQNFANHVFASYNFDWDLAQSLWIKNQLHQFKPQQQTILEHFIALFETNQKDYQQLRRKVIHNDLNDNNILVSHNEVSGFIDFGDASHTQLINEVAILCAYALMHKPDPLAAAAAVIKGYHNVLPLQKNELAQLYHLIGMRLTVSVIQAAIARTENPDNVYKSFSEQAAWELLQLWQQTPSQLAHYTFRHACGLTAHPRSLSENRKPTAKSLDLASFSPNFC